MLREVKPIPRVEDIFAWLTGAIVFSKIDANTGFWQIPLLLVTPTHNIHHTIRFNKLPFSISITPELFQKRMNKILAGVTGLIDDTLIHGN